MRVAVLTDYPVVCFANGPSLATQALKRYLERRGHEVTIVGPRPGPEAPPAAPGSLLLDSVAFRAHPSVRLPFAWPPAAFENRERFDVVHGHANSSLMHWAPIMRALHGVPCLSTNTVFLPGFAQYVLPESLYQRERVRALWSRYPARAVEASFSKAYNAHDGLIVQCDALARYWREHGLSVPLHVIPRPIDTALFDQPLGRDPFRPSFARGKRLLVVCRHAREKDLHTILEAFARRVAPRHPDATLTLVGDGQEHLALRRLAASLGVAGCCDFPGERPQRELRHFYGHADLFVYASLTETYGQVISEALWCGCPVVALDDAMGVAFQVKAGHDGLLVGPGEDNAARLGDAIDLALSDGALRRGLSERAAARARERVAPDVVYARYESAYESAIEHARSRATARRPGGADLARVMKDHLMPWTAQHALLVALAAMRSREQETYAIPKVRIDAIPEAVAPRRDAPRAEDYAAAS